MHCIVKKTLQLIVEKQNDYLVKVKGNQFKLFKEVKAIVASAKPIAINIENEKRRGRYECRITSVFLPTDQLPDGWCQLNRIIHVKRRFVSKKKTHYTDSYYISSIISDEAALFAKGIRIENRLHYVKDAIMKEDYIKNNSKNAPGNMSLIRNIAVNIFNQNDFQSIKHASLFFASNIEKLFTLISRRT